jgi:hypothetical protein
MKAVTEFERVEENTSPSVFIPIVPPKGRPRLRYRLRVNTADDVRVAGRAGIPLFWLDSTVVTMLGYPMEFPPRVVAARNVLPAVSSSRKVQEMESSEALLHPRWEDVTLMLLRFDPVAARAVLDRHRNSIDADYLVRRVVEERLLAPATFVRFFDIVPTVPRFGESILRSALERKLSSNRAGALL